METKLVITCVWVLFVNSFERLESLWHTEDLNVKLVYFIQLQVDIKFTSSSVYFVLFFLLT